MKPETIEIIRNLLIDRRELAKSQMLSAITNRFTTTISAKIAEYQDIYDAYEDFCDWESEQGGDD